jgi:hypothetical protein
MSKEETNSFLPSQAEVSFACYDEGYGKQNVRATNEYGAIQLEFHMLSMRTRLR